MRRVDAELLVDSECSDLVEQALLHLVNTENPKAVVAALAPSPAKDALVARLAVVVASGFGVEPPPAEDRLAVVPCSLSLAEMSRRFYRLETFHMQRPSARQLRVSELASYFVRRIRPWIDHQFPGMEWTSAFSGTIGDKTLTFKPWEIVKIKHRFAVRCCPPSGDADVKICVPFVRHASGSWTPFPDVTPIPEASGYRRVYECEDTLFSSPGMHLMGDKRETSHVYDVDEPLVAVTI